jgi:DNA modification methylase
VHSCITSPPYWQLRDYNVAGQLGLEESPEAYVQKMVQVFGEVRRVLRDDGTLWLNLGDSYANTGMRDPSKVGGFTGERIRNKVASSPESVGEFWLGEVTEAVI